jgi:hypothetical protein
MAPTSYVLYSKMFRLLDARLSFSVNRCWYAYQQANGMYWQTCQKFQSDDALYYLALRIKQSMRVLANVSGMGGRGKSWLDVTQ